MLLGLSTGLRLHRCLIRIFGIVENLALISYYGVVLGQADRRIGVRAMPEALEDAGVDFRLCDRDLIVLLAGQPHVTQLLELAWPVPIVAGEAVSGIVETSVLIRGRFGMPHRIWIGGWIDLE